ncbi:MAG: HlyD family efflux transporter periplasmic adaptor subunit, partial [Acidobacteria bacterium]|nr:HlyD family efflux transporter periplasmic adaptor subunit [Acidobacteriota bacterium]
KLKQLQTTYELKRTAEKADLRVLEIRRDRSQATMRYAEGNSEKMAIKSPIEGLVVINSVWKGGSMGEVLEGDEVRPGLPIMQVVNPKSMEVRARVNQADMPFLKVGQLAQFHLDAFPDLVFSGKLERVAAMGTASNMNDYVRSFSAVFSIVGNDPHLLPDLASAVDAELERLRGTLIVPRDAVETEGGKSYVRVQHGSNWERREVKIVAENNVEFALESGLEAGDVVMRKTQAPTPAGGPS